MIIVKLFGGLGNQLFQYAFGRAVSLRSNCTLKLDLSAFSGNNDYIKRAYGLSAFVLVAEMAAPEEVVVFKKNKLLAWLERIRPFYKRATILEPYYHVAPELLVPTDNHFYVGYWQSEQYFTDVAELIKKDLTLRSECLPETTLIKHITETNSVSLHVRRGDYVSNPAANQVHGTCTVEYYQKALAYIAVQHPDMHVFIFSDDPQWVQENLNISQPTTIVSNNLLKDYQELYLMSLCKHNIIANSSFSWWGAWLNNNGGKIVVAPQQWFNDTKSNTKDLLPLSWIRL